MFLRKFLLCCSMQWNLPGEFLWMSRRLRIWPMTLSFFYHKPKDWLVPQSRIFPYTGRWLRALWQWLVPPSRRLPWLLLIRNGYSLSCLPRTYTGFRWHRDLKLESSWICTRPWISWFPWCYWGFDSALPPYIPMDSWLSDMPFGTLPMSSMWHGFYWKHKKRISPSRPIFFRVLLFYVRFSRRPKWKGASTHPVYLSVFYPSLYAIRRIDRVWNWRANGRATWPVLDIP